MGVGEVATYLYAEKKNYEEIFQYIAKRKRIKGNCNTEQKF